MRFQKKEANSTKDKNKISIIEKIGHKIPDPVIIFIGLYILVMLTTLLTSNITFETVGQNGDTVVNHIRNMFTAENIRWIFDRSEEYTSYLQSPSEISYAVFVFKTIN